MSEFETMVKKQEEIETLKKENKNLKKAYNDLIDSIMTMDKRLKGKLKKI